MQSEALPGKAAQSVCYGAAGSLLGARREKLTLILSNDDVNELVSMEECIERLDLTYQDLGNGLAHTLVICSHSEEVQQQFPNRWHVSKHADAATVRRVDAEMTWFPHRARQHSA